MKTYKYEYKFKSDMVNDLQKVFHGLTGAINDIELSCGYIEDVEIKMKIVTSAYTPQLYIYVIKQGTTYSLNLQLYTIKDLHNVFKIKLENNNSILIKTTILDKTDDVTFEVSAYFEKTGRRREEYTQNLISYLNFDNEEDVLRAVCYYRGLKNPSDYINKLISDKLIYWGLDKDYSNYKKTNVPHTIFNKVMYVVLGELYGDIDKKTRNLPFPMQEFERYMSLKNKR